MQLGNPPNGNAPRPNGAAALVVQMRKHGIERRTPRAGAVQRVIDRLRVHRFEAALHCGGVGRGLRRKSAVAAINIPGVQ